MPAHTHTGTSAGLAISNCASSNVYQAASGSNTGSTGGGQSHSHTLSANFVGSANDNLQPYLVLIYIIKT